VLAVPNDAVRNVREGVATAVLLGLNPDSVQAEVQRQMAASSSNGMAGGGGNGQGAASAPGAASAAKGTTARESRGEVALASQQGFQQQLPEVTDEQCKQVRDAFAKHPDAQGKLQALFQRMRAGELDMQQMRSETEAIYKTLGVDGRVARACQMRERGGQGGRAGAGGGAAGSGRGDLRNAQTSTPTPNAQRSGTTATQQPKSATSAPVPAGEFSVARSRARPALVFVADSGGYKPRVVRVGASNLDYTEIVSGLQEGERVALLSVAQAAASRAQQNERIRTMTGGGMPGMQQRPTTQGGARPRP
jgi:HlyD family secretion protein